MPRVHRTCNGTQHLPFGMYKEKSPSPLAQSDPFPMQIPLQHVPKGGIRWPELRVQIVKSVRPTTVLFNEGVCYIDYGATYTGASGKLRSRGGAGFQVSLF